MKVHTSAMHLSLILLTLLLTFVATSPIKKNSQLGSIVQGQISAFGPHLISFGRIATITAPPFTISPPKATSVPRNPVTTLPQPGAPSAENCGNIYIARGEINGFIVPTTTTKILCPTTVNIDARETHALSSTDEIDPEGAGTIFIAKRNADQVFSHGQVTGAIDVGRFSAPAPTHAPFLKSWNKELQHDLHTRIDPPASISSASPTYTAYENDFGEQRYPLLPPLPTREIIKFRHTAQNATSQTIPSSTFQKAPTDAGPTAVSNGGIISIARNDEDHVEARQTSPGGGGAWQAGGGSVISVARNNRKSDDASKSPQHNDEDGFLILLAKNGGWHDPTTKSLTKPGLTTLTVPASTGRETGAIFAITSVQIPKQYNTHSSKTTPTVRSGTYTVSGGSVTVTVITTLPTPTKYGRLEVRIPSPEWLETHTKPYRAVNAPTTKDPAHTHIVDSPSTLEVEARADLEKGIPTPEWLGTHTIAHHQPSITTSTKTTYVAATSNFYPLSPIKSTFKPAPTPSCTLTVKPLTVTAIENNFKLVHVSATTVTQYQSCGGCLLEMLNTMERMWDGTVRVEGVDSVTIDKCIRKTPDHGMHTKGGY